MFVRVYQVFSGVGHSVQILRRGLRRLATRSSVSLERQRPFTHVYHAESTIVRLYTALLRYIHLLVTYW